MLSNEKPSLFKKLKLQRVTPTKTLGQNFLYDPSLIEKIIEGEDLANKIILEIGPGPGMLTEAILKRNPKKLTVIEKDRRLVDFLKDNLGIPHKERLEIIEEDALKINLEQIFDNKGIIISNLPYNISVKLLSNWFDELKSIDKMILMFQKEVGDRIIAKRSTKEYGSLSVTSQWLCEIQRKFDLPPGAFYPAPKIYSSVLKFVPRNTPLFAANKDKLEYLCKIMFQMRRKMVRKSLKPIISNCDQILDQLNIEETLRAENLTIEEFCKLSFFISS